MVKKLLLHPDGNALIKSYSSFNGYNVHALVDYVHDIQDIYSQQLKIFSKKLINRSVYEAILLEVTYKFLDEYTKKGLYHIRPQLSTFVQDHEDKIDNIVQITKADISDAVLGYEIGIQLTASSNILEKFSKIVPLVDNDVIFLDLNEGFKQIKGRTPMSSFHANVSRKYNQRLKTGPVGGYMGDFPFFINKLPGDFIKILKDNLHVVYEFIAQFSLDKSSRFRENEELFRNSSGFDLEKKSYVAGRFSVTPKKGLVLEIDPSKISFDLIQRGGKTDQYLIMYGDIKNYNKTIGEMSYAVNLSTLKSTFYK